MSTSIFCPFLPGDGTCNAILIETQDRRIKRHKRWHHLSERPEFLADEVRRENAPLTLGARTDGNPPHPSYGHPLPHWGRVALLGIAHRSSRIPYEHELRKQKGFKPLPATIKTLGEWI